MIPQIVSRVRRTGLTVLVVLVMSTVLGVAAASACNPGRTPNGSYHFSAGWDTGPTFISGNCINGSSANIEVKNPYVETGQVAGWTGLGDPVAGHQALGQIGWLNTTPNYTRSNFAELVVNGVRQDFKQFQADSVGSSPNYKVTYSAGAFHLFKGGTLYYDFSDSSYAGCWAQQSGETQNWNSQLPGVPSDHETLSSAQVRFTSDNNWRSTSSWENSGAEGFCPSPFTTSDYPFSACSGAGDGKFNLTPGVHLNYNASGSPLKLDIWDMCT